VARISEARVLYDRTDDHVILEVERMAIRRARGDH
jgi:hypothetical protein